MEKIKSIVRLFVDTYKKWMDDRAIRMAAALAYYGLFSIAPIIVIVTGFVSALAERFLGDLVESTDVNMILSEILGPDVTELILQMVEGTSVGASASSSFPIVSIISIGIVLWGATSIFKYLHEALNMIWGVKPIVQGGVIITIRRYAVSFFIVFILGLLLVLYLILIGIASILLPIIIDIVPDALEILPDFRVLQISQFVILFAVSTLLFSAFYKILPDVDIEWRDVFIGAAFTSVLFGAGVFILGFYFTLYSSSIYAAAGSLIVLLLWFYYSAQIFLFGAEFTYMYATRHGSQIRPADYIEGKNDADEKNEAAASADGLSLGDEQQKNEDSKLTLKVVTDRLNKLVRPQSSGGETEEEGASEIR